MIRVVIDTNILVSGLISRQGNEALVVLAVHHGWLVPCCSEAILAEYARVLMRPIFSFPAVDVEALMSLFQTKGILVRPAYFSALSPDPDDTKFLHCAMTSTADFIVTGNKKHFPNGPYGRTNVVGAVELLDFITQEI